ncbi:hypothetical protein ACJRO7_009694 [Eucalyptus globulus]|uniref:Uncharacterized protein n=1 Tax=Eucalyptus globulus TaxID=34317 RepID=A0ABD3LF71_EUCGL
MKIRSKLDEELVPSSEKPQEIHDMVQKIADTKKDLRLFKENLCSLNFVNPLEGQAAWTAASYNLVTKEETVAAYVYKMDRPWLTPDMVRVEIRRGRALWVIGQGDEPVKVKLPSLNKMRVSKATASMNADSVLTITIPKRDQPWKWYQHKDLVFAWFKTVHVAVSS